MKKLSHNPKHAAGFTLTELMTVVIIISILAIVGGGSYKRAAEQSRFSDGLTAASSVMGAVERYYAEHFREADSTRPQAHQIDISFPRQEACSGTDTNNYCVKTKYFETTIYDGYVEARRYKGSTPQNYAARSYASTFGSNKLLGNVCVYFPNNINERTQDTFCTPLGYTSCANCPGTNSDGAKCCQKP